MQRPRSGLNLIILLFPGGGAKEAHKAWHGMFHSQRVSHYCYYELAYMKALNTNYQHPRTSRSPASGNVSGARTTTRDLPGIGHRQRWTPHMNKTTPDRYAVCYSPTMSAACCFCAPSVPATSVSILVDANFRAGTLFSKRMSSSA